MSKLWSSIELDILNKVYPEKGVCKELLEALPSRSSKAINVKASKLGIKVINPWNKLKTTSVYRNEILDYNIDIVGEYLGDKVKVSHKCLKCEHIWEAMPHNILADHGCPLCNKCISWKNNHTDIAYLYIVRVKRICDTQPFLKVGVSSNLSMRRLKDLKYSINKSSTIEVYDILDVYYGIGHDISNLETKIFKYLKELLVEPENWATFNGYTECLKYTSYSAIIDIISKVPNITKNKPIYTLNI